MHRTGRVGIESDEDRLDLLTDHESIIWTPTGGSPKTVSGVFDREYLAAEFGDTDIDTRQPMVSQSRSVCADMISHR